MKKLARIISLILIMSLSFVQAAAAEETENSLTFSDLNDTHWAYESIMKLVDAGIIQGYPDGTFQPEGYITRAELVKITNMIYSYTEKQESSNLTDIKAEDWFYENVLIAQKAGYIVGYPDNTFKPNDLITRQELCKILDEINNLVELPYTNTIADEVSPWAVGYVNNVLSNRIMALDANNNFKAVEKATRAEACDALARFLIVETPEPATGGGGSSGNAETTQEELYAVMDKVTDRLELSVIPVLSSDAQVEIVNDIISNMEKYQEDNSYDYVEAAEDAYAKYKLMPEAEQEDLKLQIQMKITTKDLLKLKEFFFPDVEL
jgi:hypothetical protein